MRPSSITLGFALLASLTAACSNVDPSEDDALTSTKKVVPNDLSILYPLPAKGHEDDLLAIDAKGARGELFPQKLAKKLPAIAPNATLADLRVVGIRVDPCFPVEGASDAKGCKNQIRLVLQPVHLDVDGKALTTEDGAVHLFYEVSRDELTTMVKELLTLRKNNGSTATKSLGVSSFLTKQGTHGKYATGLRAFVLAHAGADNLTRATFITRTNSRETQWTFGAFDVKNGALVPSPIATLGKELTQTVSNAGFGAAPAFAVTPAPRADDDASLLFRASDAEAATKGEKQAAFDAALRIENPAFHSPNTMDCASCHLATPARNWAEDNLDVFVDGNENRFTATKLSLVNKAESTISSSNIRAFGYLGDKPALSQRTVNEAAAVADWVNANLLAP